MAINVGFYNSDHEKALASRSSYEKILDVINAGLAVDADLWTYCLFKEQRNRDGFRTYDNFVDRLSRRMQVFEDYLNLESDTISSIDERPDKFISEYIGVGCGLKLISQIHGLTEADWEIIPEGPIKDLDYQIASDGNTIIEVECKGTFEGSSRSSMKASIESKKEVQRNKQNNKHILYGVITSYYFDDSKPAYAEILDPDPIEIYSDPRLVRLMNRLKYYLLQFNTFSKAHFLISLSERINILKNIRNYTDLDGVTLTNRYGEPFSTPVSFDWKRPLKEHGHIIGQIFHVSDELFLFYGISHNVVNLLIKQDHKQILEYREKSNVLTASANAQYPSRIFAEEAENILVKGIVYQNSAGLAFGILRDSNY